MNYTISLLYCKISISVCWSLPMPHLFQFNPQTMSVSRVYADVIEKMPPDYSDYDTVSIDWL